MSPTVQVPLASLTRNIAYNDSHLKKYLLTLLTNKMQGYISFIYQIPDTLGRVNHEFKRFYTVFQIKFRRIRKFLGLPDSDPLGRGADPDPYKQHQAKKVRKALIYTIYDFKM